MRNPVLNWAQMRNPVLLTPTHSQVCVPVRPGVFDPVSRVESGLSDRNFFRVASRGSAEPGRSDAVVLVIWRETPAYLQGLCLARQYVIHRGFESFDHAPFLLRHCDVFNVVWRSCFSRRPRCCGGLSTAMATFGPGLDMQ